MWAPSELAVSSNSSPGYQLVTLPISQVPGLENNKQLFLEKKVLVTMSIWNGNRTVIKIRCTNGCFNKASHHCLMKLSLFSEQFNMALLITKVLLLIKCSEKKTILHGYGYCEVLIGECQMWNKKITTNWTIESLAFYKTANVSKWFIKSACLELSWDVMVSLILSCIACL